VPLRGFVPSLVLGLLDIPAGTLNNGIFPLVAFIAAEKLYIKYQGKPPFSLVSSMHDENKRKTILKFSTTEITLSTRTFPALSDPCPLLFPLIYKC